MLASYWISARGVTMETNAIRSERLSVLVVDDEKENLDLLRRVLVSCGVDMNEGRMWLSLVLHGEVIADGQ